MPPVGTFSMSRITEDIGQNRDFRVMADDEHGI